MQPRGVEWLVVAAVDEEDIGRLEIPVHHPQVVKLEEGGGDLFRGDGHEVLVHPVGLRRRNRREVALKRAARTVLEHSVLVRGFTVTKLGEHVGDVRMTHTARRRRGGGGAQQPQHLELVVAQRRLRRLARALGAVKRLDRNLLAAVGEGAATKDGRESSGRNRTEWLIA